MNTMGDTVESNQTESARNLRASLLASMAINGDPIRRNKPLEAVMAEPTSSAAGGLAAWKVGAGILGIGVVASALGFLVLLPKTPREAAMRALATMTGSSLFGPVLVAALYSRWPELFAAGVQLAAHAGLEPWAGLFVIGAPVLAIAGLPFWWVLGALVLWFDRRKWRDLGELVNDARDEFRR